MPKGPQRRAKLILAMIVARILETGRQAGDGAPTQRCDAARSVGAMLGLGEVDEDEFYATLDLLGRSQSGVEKVLAHRHLEDGVLVLYDVTSGYPRPRSAHRRSPRPKSPPPLATKPGASASKTASLTAHGVLATASHRRGVRTEAIVCQGNRAKAISSPLVGED